MNKFKIAASVLGLAWLGQITAALAAESVPDSSVTDLLARAFAASGGASAWESVCALEVRGRITSGGQQGDFRSREDPCTGRYTAGFEIGLFEGGQGFDGRQAWARRPGGDVTVIDAEGARKAAADQAWLVRRAYWFDSSGAATWQSLDRVEEGDRTFDVIEALPSGGGRIQLWFDHSTALLARIVTEDTSGPQTEYLSDYRPVAGLYLPFRRLQRRGDPRYDVLIEVEAIEVSEAFADAVFSVPESRPTDYGFAAGADSTRLSFDLEGNHVLVSVRVNGQPLRFVFDSGGVNLLTRPTAERLGLEAVGEVQGQGAGEASMPISLVTVDTVSIGDLTFSNQTFFVAPLEQLSARHGLSFDGMIGYEVLRRLVVELDYAEQRLTLTEPTAYEHAGTAAPIPLRFADRTPIVTGSLDGIAGEFSIDTGARSALTLTAPFVARHRLADRYAVGSERVVGWGIGGPVLARVGRARRLEIGGVEVDWPVTALYSGERGALADDSLAGNVGGEILRRFRTTFDYSRRRMYLEPNALHDVPDRFDRSGLSLWLDGEHIEVAHVAEDSPAALAGLRVGDRLVEVDGREVDSTSLAAVRNALKERPAGTRIVVRYERAGQTGRVSVALADLVPPDPREAAVARHAGAVDEIDAG